MVDAIVRQNDNIFLGVMGHLSGEELNKYTSVGGKTQYCIRTDYQDSDVDNIPAAMFRYYTFKPNKDSVYAYTYDLSTQSYITGASSQFSFYYPMEHSPVVSVTGVSVSQTTANIALGTKLELIPVVMPTNATNRSVSWTSSQPSVATVNSRGLVTAVAEGTTTITATTQDGGKTASSVITVFGVPVTGVTLRWSVPISYLGVGTKQQLIATVLPTNATNKSMSWDSDNTSVATVNSSGLVTAVAAGTAAITVTTQDGRKTATVTATVIAPTSVEMSNGDVGLPKEFGISAIYPNPFNPTTTIQYSLAEMAELTLAVYNVEGQLMKTLFQGNQPAGSYEIRWDATSDTRRQITSGTYFCRMVVRLKNNEFVETRKMVLMK